MCRSDGKNVPLKKPTRINGCELGCSTIELLPAVVGEKGLEPLTDNPILTTRVGRLMLRNRGAEKIATRMNGVEPGSSFALPLSYRSVMGQRGGELEPRT